MKKDILTIALAVLLLFAGCNTVGPDQPDDSTPAPTPTSTATHNQSEESPQTTSATPTPEQTATDEVRLGDGPIDRPLNEYANYPAAHDNYTLRYYNLLDNPVDMDELTRFDAPDPDAQDAALRNITYVNWTQVNEDTTRLNIGVNLERTEYTNSVLSRVFMRYAFVLNQSIQDENEWDIDEINLEVSVDGEPLRANRIDSADAVSWLRYREGPDTNISTKLEQHLLHSSVFSPTASSIPSNAVTHDFGGITTAAVDAPQYRQAIDDEIGDRAQVQRAQRHGRVLYVDYISQADPTDRERRIAEFTAAAFGYGRAVENDAPDTAYVLITEKIRHENGTLDTMGYVRVGAERARDAYTGETDIEAFTDNVTDWYYDEDGDLNT